MERNMQLCPHITDCRAAKRDFVVERRKYPIDLRYRVADDKYHVIATAGDTEAMHYELVYDRVGFCVISLFNGGKIVGEIYRFKGGDKYLTPAEAVDYLRAWEAKIMAENNPQYK